ncbi:MAG: TIGR00266 family protein [Myxococcota bacterium]|nr:TIGR00266 family protein [Myxococcota bacterium]MDW8363022.1 TIGR00266 family protein [Myxococcales bacterium]
MRIEIGYRPGQALARCCLEAGESVTAEAGAMVGCSGNVRMQTQAGGLMGGLRRMLGGESFFRNTFVAEGGPGEVLLAHGLCGDMTELPVTPQGWYLQNGAFVASSPHVRVEPALGGLRGFFSGAGFFVLRATAEAPGVLLVGGFGGLFELECRDDLLIDTGHLVAWEASLQYSIGKAASGWIASFLSGEGLVCRFRGRGRVLLQTRNPVEYGKAVGRKLPAAG